VEIFRLFNQKIIRGSTGGQNFTGYWKRLGPPLGRPFACRGSWRFLAALVPVDVAMERRALANRKDERRGVLPREQRLGALEGILSLPVNGNDGRARPQRTAR